MRNLENTATDWIIKFQERRITNTLRWENFSAMNWKSWEITQKGQVTTGLFVKGNWPKCQAYEMTYCTENLTISKELYLRIKVYIDHRQRLNLACILLIDIDPRSDTFDKKLLGIVGLRSGTIPRVLYGMQYLKS